MIIISIIIIMNIWSVEILSVPGCARSVSL